MRPQCGVINFVYTPARSYCNISFNHRSMNLQLSFKKKMSEIFSFMNTNMPEAEDIHEEIMNTLGNIHKFFPSWVICTCRFRHRDFFYMSENGRELLGLDPELIANSLQLEQYLERIHPQDLEHFYHCARMAGDLLKPEPPEEHYK